MRELDPERDMARCLGEQVDLPTRMDGRNRRQRGGSANVGPSDTLGYLGHCWCGQGNDHDWPGKREGAPHPRYPR